MCYFPCVLCVVCLSLCLVLLFVVSSVLFVLRCLCLLFIARFVLVVVCSLLYFVVCCALSRVCRSLRHLRAVCSFVVLLGVGGLLLVVCCLSWFVFRFVFGVLCLLSGV